MAESTLSLGYADFQRMVGYYAGYGRDTTKWTTDQISVIDDVIQTGLRNFYYPESLTDGQKAHEWSFLKPKTTLTTIADYATGTVSSSGTTVTLSGGVWPSWTATNGTLVVSGTNYAISSRTNDTVIELSSAPSTDFSDDSYTLEHDANYDLPDDFGSINGPLFFPDDEYYTPIKIVSYKLIYEYRQTDNYTSNPIYAGIQPKTTDGSDGQRYQIIFWPRPSSVWNLIYIYHILPNKISTSYPYHYGGMQHSQTILESMYAVVDEVIKEAKGPHHEAFIKRLTASIQADKSRAPDIYGYNGDNSDGYHNFYDYHVNTDNITFNNQPLIT